MSSQHSLATLAITGSWELMQQLASEHFGCSQVCQGQHIYIRYSLQSCCIPWLEAFTGPASRAIIGDRLRGVHHIAAGDALIPRVG